MLDPGGFFDALARHGFDFFTGVPDSLLKEFCAYVTDHTGRAQHIIAANEGGAVALAAGHYVATGRPSVVYMQNSGQGNAVNPLTSLADNEVFGIPMLLLVGWRGEPGVHDEPQHVKQGKITLDLFRALRVEYIVLRDEMDQAVSAIEHAVSRMSATSAPYALIVRKGTFGSYQLKTKVETAYAFSREAALRLVIDSIGENAIVVATTGMTSRELFEHRQASGHTHAADFRTVGCMGHASQIALGIALARPDKTVYCLDGDGAVIMHMGALAIVGSQRPRNFRHIVFNNGAHDSVGGQPTTGFEIAITGVASACGYRVAISAETCGEISAGLETISREDGPVLLEIRVNKGARANLGRPTSSPAENKRELMRHLCV